MALSQKRVPTVSDVDTQRAFQQVYDDINEVINAVNQGHTSKDRTSNTGKSGDMRIGRDALGNHFLELCTDEGWVVSSNSVPSGFIPKGSTEDSNDTHILGGKVGIGTTTIDSDVRLEVNSTIRASAVSDNSPSFSLKEIGGGGKKAAFGLALANGQHAYEAVDGDGVLRAAGNFLISTEESSGWKAGMVMKVNNGNVGIGVTAPTSKLHIDQASASGAMPVLKLDQGDVDDSFIHFIGTSGTLSANSISSSTDSGSNKVGAIKIEVNGSDKWIRVYDSAV